MVWSIKSNAAEKSSNTTTAYWPLSTARRTPLKTCCFCGVELPICWLHFRKQLVFIQICSKLRRGYSLKDLSKEHLISYRSIVVQLITIQVRLLKKRDDMGCLKEFRKITGRQGIIHIHVIYGRSLSRHALTRWVGIGSKRQDLVVESAMSFLTCVWVTGWNSENSLSHEELLSTGTDGGEAAMMSFILLKKKMPKSFPISLPGLWSGNVATVAGTVSFLTSLKSCLLSHSVISVVM